MFYPYAFSRVCGEELKLLNQRWDEVASTGVSICAVSCDAIHTLRAYADELNNPAFTLVSDFWPHGQIARAYGVFNGATGAPKRVSFVVDDRHRIRNILGAENAQMRDFEDTLRALRALS